MTPWEQRSEDINYAAKKRTKLMVFIEIWNIGAITNHHLRKRKNAREMACCSIGYWPLIRTTLCLSGILKNMAFGKLCFIWKFFRVAILFYYIFFISLSQFLEHKSGVILETGLRVVVIPLNGTPRYVMLTISLFEELYMPYFVQSFANLIALDQFEDIK